MRSLHAILLSALLPLLACSGDGRNTDALAKRWLGTMDTLPGGAIQVHNPERGLWTADEVPKPTEDLRIASQDATGKVRFGEVRSFQVDRQGRVFVLDDRVSQIAVFDSNGALVRTFGRAGNGPGEFVRPSGMRLAPDGTLWVKDAGNHRFVYFDTAGRALGTVPGLWKVSSSPWHGAMTNDGRLYDHEMAMGEDGAGVLVHYDAKRGPVDSVRLPLLPKRELFRSPTQSWLTQPVPFASERIWAFDPRGYIWHAASAEYRIMQITLSGDTVRIIERPFTRTPVENGMREHAAKMLASPDNEDLVIDVKRIPTVYPALQALHTSTDSLLWVEPIYRASLVSQYDAFDSQGRFLGTVSFPTWLAPGHRPIFSARTAYAIVTDSNDVPAVVRYRWR